MAWRFERRSATNASTIGSPIVLRQLTRALSERAPSPAAAGTCQPRACESPASLVADPYKPQRARRALAEPREGPKVHL
eukprot:9017156-Alexandrium_andersonii.AAC.1